MDNNTEVKSNGLTPVAKTGLVCAVGAVCLALIVVLPKTVVSLVHEILSDD